MAKKKKEEELDNGFGVVSDEAKQEEFDEAEEELGGVDGPPRWKVVDGVNVFWALPPFGTMKNFIARVKMHYGPMHVCGRAGKRPDPQTPKKTIDDKDFSNCYRCIEAWNAYEAAGKPGTGNPKNQNPVKSKFKENLGSDQGLVQGVDLTPFFDTSGPEPELNASLADRVVPYLEAMVMDDPEEQTAAIDEICEGLSEEVAERVTQSVLSGVSPLTFNYDTTNDLEGTEAKCRRDWRKRKRLPKAVKQAVERGPLSHPEYFLCVVDRKDGEQEFESRGKKRKKKVYNITFLTPDDLEDNWTEIDGVKEALWAVAHDGVIDLNNPSVEDDADISTRARSFVRLTDDEIAEYLEAENHSFEVKESDNDGTEDVGDDDLDVSDPASFGPIEDSVHSTKEDADVLAKAKAKRAAAE